MKNNLKLFRNEKRLTQINISKKVGLETQHYQRYEYGLHVPNVYTAIRIARVLKTTVEELFPLERPNLEGIEASKNKTR